MVILKEFFRYEFVGNRFACEDCDDKRDVVRCTCWLCDEGDREVIWYQCCACLRGEFQLDTRDDFNGEPGLRDLSAWLKTDRRDPLITSCDHPYDGRTLGELLLEIMSK
jgi:hypothetical protein